MPIFDTVCNSCGYTREVIVKMNEEEMPPCKKCGQQTKKILTSNKDTGVSFRLYGQGFYKKTPRDTGDFA